MNTRTLILGFAALSTVSLAACSNAGNGGSSTSSFSYSEASSAMMQASSAMTENSSAMMEASSSSSMMQNSSAMMQESSASSLPLAANNGTVPDTVQSFFISAMHQTSFNDAFVTASPYLSDGFKSALQSAGNIEQALFCTNQKPNDFTFAAKGASQTQRDVVLTEKFHDAADVMTTVSVVHEADGWKVDRVTCQ